MTDANTPRAGASASSETASPEARRYRSPELIEYGSIAKLTQGNKSTMADGPAGGFRQAAMKMCL